MKRVYDITQENELRKIREKIIWHQRNCFHCLFWKCGSARKLWEAYKRLDDRLQADWELNLFGKRIT